MLMYCAPLASDSAQALVTLMGSFVYAFATFIMGLFLAYVGYQQWVNSRRKTNLDLFEKRIGVYRQVKLFLDHCFLEGVEFQESEWRIFNRLADDVEFLFGGEVAEFFQQISDSAKTVVIERHALRSIPGGTEARFRLDENLIEMVRPINEARDKLREVFRPYLSFAEIKSC